MAEQLRPASLKASAVARVHTVLAYAAFTSALIIGCLLHYKKIVKNGVAGYPQEWFPSVSATIGDWYPERNVFQILIALTSGPRFALVYLQYYLHVQQLPERAFWPKLIFATGIIRTLSCGGWVYITSSDDHDAHDFFMILYMVSNLPWMVGGVLYSKDRRIRKQRTWVSSMFFSSIVPLIYFFIQHKVYRIPGAYTHYAFFEWSLIFFDVLYDSISEKEFRKADLKITLGVTLRDQPSDQIKSGKKSTVEKKETVAETSTISVSDITTTTTANHARSSHLCTAYISAIRPSLSVLSDVYLSYVFQTLFTALIPSLFYFSIWELGIAGQELALCAVLSPFLLGFSAIRAFSKGRTGQIILQALSFSGLVAYALKKPLHRLAIVTPSVAIGLLAAAATWTSNDGGYQAAVFGLSWIASSLAKHANHTNNPLWPFIHEKSGGYNKTGLVLAIIALVEQTIRSQKVPKIKSTGTVNTPNAHWLAVALPLGSLVFSIHNMLAESSTLVAWSWTGYENNVPRGPLPHVHSALTIVIQSLGLAFALYGYLPSRNTIQNNTVEFRNLADKNGPKDIAHTSNLIQPIINSPCFFVFGVISAYILYHCKNWTGYAAGLGLAFFYMSIIPVIFERLAAIASMQKAPLGRTLGTAFVVYCLLNLASIFTVAYAFVPGGVYFRERTDLVLIAQFALLVPLYLSPRPKETDLRNSAWSRGMTSTKASYIYLLLSVFSILSGIVTVHRLPSSPPQPFRPGPRIIRAGIWTIHFGFDNEGHDSQRGVRNLIRDMELDIVGLLETDLHRTSFGHRDLTRVIIEDLGYNVDIGPGPNQHTWGCVLLSKFPIINSTHHLLPSPHGELAPAIEAVLDVYGTEVTVVVSHNGQEEDPLDRELQSTELARIMSASYPKPVIFLGYVVTKPHAKRPNPYEIMTIDGRVHDIDGDDKDRWCEYIFYRRLYRTSYARISRGIITDTEMQIGQFILPRHGASVTNDTTPARYLRCRKEQLPVEHWFPMEYYGAPGRGGVDGHFYHVFNTPLYYEIPEGAAI